MKRLQQFEYEYCYMYAQQCFNYFLRISKRPVKDYNEAKTIVKGYNKVINPYRLIFRHSIRGKIDTIAIMVMVLSINYRIKQKESLPQ